MATMPFLLLTVFVSFAGVLCAADQREFQRALFERYDRKDLVCIAPGLVLGLDISEGLQPNFAVEYTHFDESLTIPERYRRQEQLDERTFGDSEVRGAAFDRLAPGERLYVSEFYISRDSIVFNLISPSITRFVRSVKPGEKKFFGVKFTFVFPLDTMRSGDYEAVVREINKYLLPGREYRTALQAAEEQKKATRRVEIQPGVSEEEIIKVLGAPERTVVFGKKTILNYPDVSIELEDNRIVDVKIR
jgi:hypothetical protein